MNLVELTDILEATGFPVAYSHFIETSETPFPELPFICFLETFTTNFDADNTVFRKVRNVQIELYTKKKDISAEDILEAVLQSNEIPFQSSESFIESEEIFQKIYEVRLL